MQRHQEQTTSPNNDPSDSFSIIITTDPLQNLKALTEKEISKLSQERHSMQAIHSNLDLLIKRYNLKKSYLGQISEWYGSRPWWGKILLLIVLAGLAAGIGMLCHIPITLALVTSAVYIFFSFFFINHYKVSKNQTKLLCEDIIELEKSLAETIKHFDELKTSLQAIMLKVHELHDQSLEDMQALQTNIKNLAEKVAVYSQIIQQLEAVQASLHTTSQGIAEELSLATTEYHDCHTRIAQHSQQITGICNNLDITHKSLTEDSELLNKLTKAYSFACSKINKATEQMDALLQAIIKVTDTQENIAQKSLTDARNASNDPISLSSSQTTEVYELNIPDENLNSSKQLLQQARESRDYSTQVRRQAEHLLASKPKPSN